LYSVIFQVIFYTVTFWFLYKETKIIDKLTRILVPALVLMEVTIIGYAIISPLGPQAQPNFEGSVIARGFVDGYQTIDLICALMFASIIIVDIKHRLGPATSKLNYYLVITGLFGFLIMSAIQCGEMFRGSTASVLLPDVNYAKLSATIVLEQMGTAAGMGFNICLVLACLTTAIGLISGCGRFLASATKGRLSYISACILTSVCAFLTSITGLATIVQWVTPVLQLIYPPAIALTLCLCFLTPYQGGMRGACYATAIYGLLDALHLWLPMLGFAGGIPGLAAIPGQANGLGFVWFMVLGWLLGHFVLWKEERFFYDPTKQASVE
jgi:LIVCS family branched-chain amino acid:cation transporter